MGGTFETLNVAAARKSGILQMVTGGLCIFFNIAIFVFKAASWDYLGEYQQSGSGIWGGVFYIVSGALIFVASKKLTFGYVVAALALNVISLFVNLFHVIWMSVSIMSEERRYFLHSWWDEERVRRKHITLWRYPVYVPLFSISTILAYVGFCLVTWAVFLLSEAFYWRRFNEITDVEEKPKNDADGVGTVQSKATESSFNHALAVSSVKVNAVFHALVAALSACTNVAVIAIVVWGLQTTYERMNITNGTAIITAPFFFAVAYFGYTAGKTGSNKRIVTFLVLSVFCGLLSFLEGGGGVVAICNRWDMDKQSIQKCVTKPNYRGRNRTTCEWIPRENAGEFVPALITLNAIIIFFALIHLAMSIWGVIIGSTALHKDGTCFRCFRNCFCGNCNGNGCGDVSCADSCCVPAARGGGAAGAHYQPIQFVVSHQGTTTLANGQQALVVLLPLNGNMNVSMDGQAGGQATVTVDGAQGQTPNSVVS